MLVFATEKTSTRNDEAYEILVVETDGRSKTTKSPTRQISMYQSVLFTGAKIRVSEEEALELRLSMFQSRRGVTGNQIGSAEKLSIYQTKVLVLIYYIMCTC